MKELRDSDKNKRKRVDRHVVKGAKVSPEPEALSENLENADKKFRKNLENQEISHSQVGLRKL